MKNRSRLALIVGGAALATSLFSGCLTTRGRATIDNFGKAFFGSSIIGAADQFGRNIVGGNSDSGNIYVINPQNIPEYEVGTQIQVGEIKWVKEEEGKPLIGYMEGIRQPHIQILDERLWIYLNTRR